MRLSNWIFKTNSSLVQFILRLGLGIVIMPHGLQKLLGVFGGHGAFQTVEMWSLWWNIPAIITWFVIIIESFGMLFLILGFFTRIIALFLFGIMAGAVYLVHFQYGFFMNWYSKPNLGEGFEYHLLVFTILIALILFGGGSYSMDRKLDSIID